MAKSPRTTAMLAMVRGAEPSASHRRGENLIAIVLRGTYRRARLRGGNAEASRLLHERTFCVFRERGLDDPGRTLLWLVLPSGAPPAPPRSGRLSRESRPSSLASGV